MEEDEPVGTVEILAPNLRGGEREEMGEREWDTYLRWMGGHTGYLRWGSHRVALPDLRTGPTGTNPNHILRQCLYITLGK